MRIERCEADSSRRQSTRPQHRRAEIQSLREQRGWWSEVVRLLRLRKHKGHIVPLVAPRVLVHRREKNPVRRMEYDPPIRQILRDSESRGKIMRIRVHQPRRIALLPADKNRRHAILENQVRVGIVFVIQRA